MNDITILQKMLNADPQVPLQQKSGKYFVTLRDKQANTTVEIIDVPDNSIVIRAEAFDL